jgi:hypothetical protein
MFEDIVVSPCLLRDSLTAQKYRNSLRTVLPGLLEGRGRVCVCSVTELQHNREDSGNGWMRRIRPGEADMEGCEPAALSPRLAMIQYV